MLGPQFVFLDHVELLRGEGHVGFGENRRNQLEEPSQVRSELNLRGVQAELDRVGKMRKEVDKIIRAAETLHDQLRIGGDKLGKLLDKAKATLASLDIELHDREVEVANPIAVPGTAS